MKRSFLIGAGVIGSVLAVSLGAALADARHGAMGMREGRGPAMMIEEFDTDGDGKVTAAEIEAHRAARFAELDTDGNGQVSRDEFMAHAAAKASERAAEMFERLDADGDGTLSRDAIEAMGGRGGPDAERLIARFDADGDGAISAEEIDSARIAFRAQHGDHDGMGRMMRRGEGDGGWHRPHN